MVYREDFNWKSGKQFDWKNWNDVFPYEEGLECDGIVKTYGDAKFSSSAFATQWPNRTIPKLNPWHNYEFDSLNGIMSLVTRAEPIQILNNQCGTLKVNFTSAKMVSVHEYHYGKFELVARMENFGRSWPSFWMYGKCAQEFDAFEFKDDLSLARKEISIECNPSSNYLIGTFKRYSKHPIKRFYNLGLTHNSEEIENCPQLSVSINTDDQGIFGTSLENEYALLYKALDKETDEEGKQLYNSTMIYDWLDRIRKMGVEQSFR